VTGQAGWYDVRVRLRPAQAEREERTSPQVAPTPAPPGVRGSSGRAIAYFATRGKR
jgi:hypothetical protein